MRETVISLSINSAQSFAQCSGLFRAEVKSPAVRFGRAVLAAGPRRFIWIGPAGSTAADEDLAFHSDSAVPPRGKM